MKNNQIQIFNQQGLTKHWLIFGILLLCAIVLTLLGWGAIMNNTVAILLGLIPIALSVVLLGLWRSLVITLVIGLICMMGASGLESPILQRLFSDPMVSIIPKLLCVLIAWAEFRHLKRRMDDNSKSAKFIITGLTASNVVLLNLILTFLSISIFHSDLFGVDGFPDSMLEQSAIINHVITFSFVYEYIATVVISIAVAVFYYRNETNNTSHASMQKTIRKWLSLALTSMALIIIGISFSIDTIFERRQAEETIRITLDNLANDYESISKKITYRELLYHLGQRGHTILVRDNELIGTDQSIPPGITLKDLELDRIKLNDFFTASYQNTQWKCGAKQTNDGSILIGMIPEYEIHVNRNRTIIENIIAISMIIMMIYFIISQIMKVSVTLNVQKISEGLTQISEGDLNTRLKILNNLEFSQISDDINHTVQSLQDAQAEVNRRIKTDLDLAHAIQMAMLPQNSIKQDAYEIAASYVSAKEVGGDFYDYFELPGHRIGLVMADVSGKGIPAAMFMMTAKTIIKNISTTCQSPATVLERANTQLCENNDAEMFVTLWLGFVDLNTGKLTFANAGHNPPLLKHVDHTEYLDHKHYKRGLMLSAFESSKYGDNEIQLSKGDRLILYTDGITEACNSQLELYGEKRLEKTIQNTSASNVIEILESITHSVLEFENGKEQADDKTIMVFGL